MGINLLPQVRMYWDKDEIIGNTGIKKVFPVRRYLKLIEYLHASDCASEPGCNDDNYDKLFKIHPIMEMVQCTFCESYKPGKQKSIDEGVIAYKG